MKQGYLCKSAGDAPGEEELIQINRFTRRELAAEEVYVFSVVLCDNEIDRDGERFTIGALHRLAELFVGKTGIFDHSMKSGGQTARIFSCRVEQLPDRATQAGEPYHRLTARAYLPKTEQNQGFIAELDAGIKKEVSVGCAVDSVTCSICGAELREQPCAHQRGRRYEGGLCHAVLDRPTDAYEWSFVAVPAQREAGVIKAYRPEESTDCDLPELLAKGEAVALSAEQARRLSTLLSTLEADAADGRRYRQELEQEVLRLSALVQPELEHAVMRRLAGRMTTGELKAFQAAYRSKAQRLMPCEPQIPGPARRNAEGNASFQI